MLRAVRFVLLMTVAVVASGCADGDGQSKLKERSPGIPTSPAPKITKPEKAAPDQYRVKLETTRGDIVLDVNRKWAPIGADRFHELVTEGFYDDCRFFRVMSGFMAQCGINGDPQVQAKWRDAKISDDPVAESNKRGTITFATSGRNSRTTQFFINFADNGQSLDRQGFAPFAKVVDGMNIVDTFYSGYGEGAPRGNGPDQTAMQFEGNKYLERNYPKLDYIKKATIVTLSPNPTEKGAEKSADKPADEKPAAEKK
jgi:peptidyl-prolyl cis-trans isomerase A (cyclophilin A)